MKGLQKKKIVSFVLFVVVISSVQGFEVSVNYSTPLLWPLPSKLSMNTSSEPLVVDPCGINYRFEAVPSDYVKQMVNVYLIDVFKCGQVPPGKITMTIVVKNPNQMVAYSKNQQKYQLTIRTSNSWQLIADYYPGFLRGLETFSQLFQRQDPNDKENKNYVINGAPILIDDIPDYQWRGLMIDSSRHFLPVEKIKHTIDGLMYSKMNVLHWHITDQDSFPVEIKSHPELSQYGKLSGSYSQTDIRSIVKYAATRGVRIVPEFDTPAHTQSWGRSPSLSKIILNCDEKYEGQFDPTLDETYNLVQDVFNEVNDLFQDQYTHFGGDQIQTQCFEQRPSIKQWMNSHNISTYKDLQVYYRQRQKKIWRNITAHKKAIYWANQDINLPVESDDLIQWWGVSKNVGALANKTNEVILSNYDLTYLDVGFGNRNGKPYGTYIKWRTLYQNFQPKIDGVNVIGGQVCMWSQLANQYVMDQKIWLRAQALNQRLWKSTGIDPSKDLTNIAQRMINQAKRMRDRGFKVEPVTVGLCEKDPSICFH